MTRTMRACLLSGLLVLAAMLHQVPAADADGTSCNENDQACFQKKYAAIAARQAEPGMSAAPCALPAAPAGAVALGAGRCVSIVTPGHPGPWKSSDIDNIEGDKSAYCPALRLTDQAGSRALTPPATSFIHEATACCNLTRLEASGDGKHLRLLSGLARDCLGGTRRSVFDETYSVDGDDLSLDESRNQTLH